MGITTVPIYFEVEKNEGDAPFGYFLGEGIDSTPPVYSKQVALMILKEFTKHLKIKQEEVEAVKACIEASGLPLEMSEDELLWMTIETLQLKVNNLYETIDQLMEGDPHEKIVEMNHVGQSGAAGGGTKTH